MATKATKTQATTLAMALRLLRTARGLTVQEAAEDMGVTIQVYRRIESGKAIDQGNFLKLLNWLLAPADK